MAKLIVRNNQEPAQVATKELSLLHGQQLNAMRFELVEYDGQREVRIYIKADQAPDDILAMAAKDRPATQAEITDAFARLMLHRRKAGLTEHTMPAFMEDVVSDIQCVAPSLYELALAIRSLRQCGRSEWFPEASEMLQHLREAKNAFRIAVYNAKSAKSGGNRLNREGRICG